MGNRTAAALVLIGLSAGLSSAQVPAGGEFQVNSYTFGRQFRAAVAPDAAGNFVVVWSSYQQDGSGYAVLGRRYDASGAPRGSAFVVNAYTTGTQWQPSVASDAVGRFVVVWDGQEGVSSGVFGRRFDGSGVPQGVDFRVNTYSTASQYRGRLARDGAGGFVVTWQSLGQDGDGMGVYAQRYDPAGALRGGEFRVNTYTTFDQFWPAVASASDGAFVVVWNSEGQDGDRSGVFAQLFDSAGTPRGSEFRVNSYTTSWQTRATVASDASGGFVVVWTTDSPDGSLGEVFGQRYDADGTARGIEFRINTYTTSQQWQASVAADTAGSFVVTWQSDGQDGSRDGIFAQRYDAVGAARGAEFRVNVHTTQEQAFSWVGTDAVGNFVVTWESYGQDGSYWGVFARRFGGVIPAALDVDASASPASDGNGVLEPGETIVVVAPSWRNLNGATQTFDGGGLSFDGPPAGGVGYELTDATAAYGTVANGATAPCTDCYQVGVSFGGTRPATHWDATFTERITPDAQGQTKPWSLHLGESFTDVAKTSPYYRFVETLLHREITGGCAADSYCPVNPVTREQMAVFALAGKEGAGYLPTACTTPVFGDVPASSPFCRFIEELVRRGVVSGCGPGAYCPTSPVTREQMVVFLLRTLDPLLDPPACGTPLFSDVPASSPFCKWIEELARRGITGGCGPGAYCPASPVTREQMAVFISATFALSLYGP